MYCVLCLGLVLLVLCGKEATYSSPYSSDESGLVLALILSLFL